MPGLGQVVPTVVWIGVIGVPCVLIFSWVYELTPGGLKRESEVDRSQYPSQQAPQRRRQAREPGR